MAPTLSPNKTWEGALGSLAGSILVTVGLLSLAHLFVSQWDKVWLSYPEDLSYWLTLAVVVNIAAQVGDLAESALFVCTGRFRPRQLQGVERWNDQDTSQPASFEGSAAIRESRQILSVLSGRCRRQAQSRGD